MSKTRSIKRSTGRKPKYEEVPPEEFYEMWKQAEPLATIYRMANGQLMTLGKQLSEQEARRVAYFLVEQYAIEWNMTVEEYIFRMLRENENDKGNS